MQPPVGREESFNDWYDSDHIPARMELPGFTGARRYKAEEGTPDYLAVYELEGLSALSTAGYQELKQNPGARTEDMLRVVDGFTRYICTELGSVGSAKDAPYLSVVAFSVPEEAEDEFNSWYAEEHVPLLMEASDWLRVRRYKVIDGIGGPWTHLALHDLAALEVMDSPERAEARSGPKRAILAEQPWFQQSGRWLYRSIGSQGSKTSADVVEEEAS
jgi:hypothetical protein